MKPLEHEETIKKYPKFTLEDKDAYYYRRVAKAQLLPSPDQTNVTSPQPAPAENAGIYTYDLDKNKQALDIWQSYQGQTKTNNHQFRYNMLKHAD